MAADAAWQLFETLVRDPTAVAFEIMTATMSGADLPPLDAVPDETLTTLLLMFTATRLQAGGDGGAVAGHEAAVRAVASARGLPGAVDYAPSSAADADAAAALNGAHGVLAQAWRADSSAAPPLLPDLISADTTLSAVPEELPAARLREIEQCRVDLAIAVARIHAEAGDHDAAFDAWQRALGRARSVDRLTGDDAATLSTVTKYCEWIGTSNPDAALRELLPAVEDVISGPARIERVELLTYLCRFYARHGDAVAEREMLQRLEAELQQLGFPDTTSGDYLDVLATWVAAATRRSSTWNERLKALYSALTGWQAVTASAVKVARGSAALMDRMRRSGELFEEMVSRQAAVAASDQQIIAAAGAPTADGLAPDFSSAQEALEEFTMLMDRWTAGETSDDLVSDLRAFAADSKQPDDRRAWSSLRAGEILTDRGHPDAASTDLEAAITLARSAGDLDPEVYARDMLIFRQVAGENFAAASTMCGRTIERIEEVRDQISTPYLESGFMQQRSPSYLMGVEMARRCSDWQGMLERIELLKARALQGPAPKQDTSAPLLAELRQLSREAADSPDRDDLRIRRRVVWERLLVEGERSRLRFDLAALQTLIAGRAVVLAYFFLAEDRLLRTCISGESVLCDKLTLDEHPEFFTALDRLGHVNFGPQSVESDLAAVAPVLLPESFAAEVEAAAQVIVCPHQSLHQVPFAALPFCGTTLIEHKPVGVVPNLTCLLNPSPQTGSSTAYFGIATRRSRDAQGRPMEVLDGAEREVRNVAKLFGTPKSVLLGPGVTREAVDSAQTRQALGSARVVHLALHGSDVADKDIADAPMEARLYLCEGPVDGLDIITWSLSADVVLLSACHAAKRATSARGLARLPADTAFGLQAAFHQAGARAVIGPLWAVADQVAPEVIRPLCAALRDGRDPAAALQHAIRSYLDGAAGSWRSPALWACFTLVGFSGDAFGFSLATS